MSLLPFVAFDSIPLDVANGCLERWGHKMGPLNRPMGGDVAVHALLHEGRPVALAIASTLIRERVGGMPHLTRGNTIELSRLCAVRPGLCRVALRLWREFVFPSLGYGTAVSYQDADLHNGNTYRFDGWVRATYCRSHGVDPRSGRRARNRWVWVWPPERAAATPCAQSAPGALVVSLTTRNGGTP